jgi:biopolymer transport protein ExbD
MRSIAPLASMGLVLVVFLGAIGTELPSCGRCVRLPTMNYNVTDRLGEHTVSITADGVWWDQERVADLRTLQQRFQVGWSRKASLPLIIADADLPYGAVRPVVAALTDAGMSGALFAGRLADR